MLGGMLVSSPARLPSGALTAPASDACKPAPRIVAILSYSPPFGSGEICQAGVGRTSASYHSDAIISALPGMTTAHQSDAESAFSN